VTFAWKVFHSVRKQNVLIHTKNLSRLDTLYHKEAKRILKRRNNNLKRLLKAWNLAKKRYNAAVKATKKRYTRCFKKITRTWTSRRSTLIATHKRFLKTHRSRHNANLLRLKGIRTRRLAHHRAVHTRRMSRISKSRAARHARSSAAWKSAQRRHANFHKKNNAVLKRLNAHIKRATKHVAHAKKFIKNHRNIKWVAKNHGRFGKRLNTTHLIGINRHHVVKHRTKKFNGVTKVHFHMKKVNGKWVKVHGIRTYHAKNFRVRSTRRAISKWSIKAYKHRIHVMIPRLVRGSHHIYETMFRHFRITMSRGARRTIVRFYYFGILIKTIRVKTIRRLVWKLKASGSGFGVSCGNFRQFFGRNLLKGFYK